MAQKYFPAWNSDYPPGGMYESAYIRENHRNYLKRKLSHTAYATASHALQAKIYRKD